MTTTPSLSPSARKGERPASAWRNWLRTGSAFTQIPTGARFRVGDTVPGIHVWPSKEVAEQKAIETKLYPGDEYLGAFPEGQRP